MSAVISMSPPLAFPGHPTVLVLTALSLSYDRYAANVLVYPFGDWYGTVRPEDVEPLMDSLLGVEASDSLSGPSSPLWRGSWFDHVATSEAQKERTKGGLEKPSGIEEDARGGEYVGLEFDRVASEDTKGYPTV